jgi:hypothetical protein
MKSINRETLTERETKEFLRIQKWIRDKKEACANDLKNYIEALEIEKRNIAKKYKEKGLKHSIDIKQLKRIERIQTNITETKAYQDCVLEFECFFMYGLNIQKKPI